MQKEDTFENLEERRDARKRLAGNQLVVAECCTMDATFKATVQDVSSAGFFIKTRRKLTLGQEIAITFTFPQTGQTIKATGEVARVSPEGAGV
jgi:Tfp pilus assembly protein PilZ